MPAEPGFDGGGAEESVVLFRNSRYPAGTAAFMNTVYGHGEELDDGNRKAAGHAGVHIIPAVFALADKAGQHTGRGADCPGDRI